MGLRMNKLEKDMVRLGLTPTGQVLIVNANLAECFPGNISENFKDMLSFVNRLPLVVPYAPDILLVQEVIREGVQYMARALSEKTGLTYKVTVCPEESVYPYPQQSNSMLTRRDCAIIINTSTIQEEDSGGYFPSLITKEECYHANNAIKEHAYQLVKDKRTNLLFPLVSLHLLPSKATHNQDIVFIKKGQWVKEICDFVERTYPTQDNQIKVIAGDFNNKRCIESEETISCEVYPFWTILTEHYGYMDSVFEIRREGEIGNPEMKRIDYIFTKGANIIDAASDLDYTAEVQNDPSYFYSDHRMNWALLKSSSCRKECVKT
jgi:endonuclease/exonuclease/phosphatase family metal-dependent hydrolase